MSPNTMHAIEIYFSSPPELDDKILFLKLLGTHFEYRTQRHQANTEPGAPSSLANSLCQKVLCTVLKWESQQQPFPTLQGAILTHYLVLKNLVNISRMWKS